MDPLRASAPHGRPHERLRRCDVLGVRVVAEPLAEVIAAVEATLERPEREALALCPLDAHSVIQARKDPALLRFLDESAFAVADGMPLVRIARWSGFPQAERARGTDVMWRILERTRDAGIGHFFYGGREGVADALAARLAEALPGIRVAGTDGPPFRPLTRAEEDGLVARIHTSGADVVWVGLSTPRQHHWAASMRGRLRVKLVCAVGAAFDFLAGSIRPAPAWMQAASLEWLYRLAREPRRLGGRYLEVVPRFAVLAGIQMLRGRR